MKKFRFMSTNTGELETDIFSVIKTTIYNYRKFHFVTRWKFNYKGF